MLIDTLGKSGFSYWTQNKELIDNIGFYLETKNRDMKQKKKLITTALIFTNLSLFLYIFAKSLQLKNIYNNINYKTMDIYRYSIDNLPNF